MLDIYTEYMIGYTQRKGKDHAKENYISCCKTRCRK